MAVRKTNVVFATLHILLWLAATIVLTYAIIAVFNLDRYAVAALILIGFISLVVLISPSILVFVFAAILAQTPDLGTSIKGSVGLIIANLIGGAFAITIYFAVVGVPEFIFLLLLMFFVSLMFASKIFFLAAGNGFGVVIDNTTGKHSYMRMIEAGGGVGLGIKTYKAVYVFNSRDALEDFVTLGWQAGGDADLEAA